MWIVPISPSFPDCLKFPANMTIFAPRTSSAYAATNMPNAHVLPHLRGVHAPTSVLSSFHPLYFMMFSE